MTSIISQAALVLRGAIDKGEPIAALTGAGVSAESGIPTFRGSGGLWRGFRAEELATPQAFRQHPERVWAWYLWRRGLVLDARPNPAHDGLAALERHHSPFTLITQNVDGLHQRAGSRLVVELHGNIHHARCTGCGHVGPLGDNVGAGETVTDVEAAPEIAQTKNAHTAGIPSCERCGAGTRPHIVWFGEQLPEQPWRQAYAAAATASLLLVVGTSAAVYPAAGLVDVTLAGGGSVIEINPEETDVSGKVSWSVRDAAGVALPALLQEAGLEAQHNDELSH